MALLAITRVTPAGPIEDELPIVASLTGLAPYEARLRLSSAPPIVLQRGLSLERARSGLALLRGRGHGAVAVEEHLLPRSEHTLQPSDFELRDDAFVGIDRGGRRYPVPFSQVLALVRAIEVVEEVRTAEKVEKKLALGRAVMTGGLMRHKQVRGEATETRTESERTLYLFRGEGPDPMVLRENALRYVTLGDEAGRTRHERFDWLVAWLHARTPGAIHDDRLCAHKRRASLSAVSGTSKDQVRVSSSADETALAAFLIVHAHLQRQL